jgi:uncharacterized protein (TIGR02117 family)
VRVLLLVLLAGCAAAPSDAPVPRGDAVIYVVARGWHTDIGLPVGEMAGPLASLEQDFPGMRFAVFGFGERRYYMARETGSGEMIAALFPSDSAILMTALRAPPEQAFAKEQVVLLHVPSSGVARIVRELSASLEKTPDGALVRLADGPYAGSVFYASNETYDAFHTCNTWTARLLRDAGLPVNPHGVLFVGQVMQQVAWIARAQARAP